MNIARLHIPERLVSAALLYQSEAGNATAIQILKGEKLKEHISKYPGLLICVIGKVVFEDEKGECKTLKTGDYVDIEPEIRHWVLATIDSQLVLIK
ncbi:MAG: quercetin dioxygenase-like cupin family protein [Marinoscillum sp.]|jgi:quercetin dioxygenase-like cupin family protein